jgi:hypothetical protein
VRAGPRHAHARGAATCSGTTTSRVRPWSGIPRRERDTMSAVSGSLATRRPRTGARCVARLALTVPCPRPPSHAPSLALGPAHAAPRRASGAGSRDHVVGHGHVRIVRGEEAPRGHGDGDQSGSATPRTTMHWTSMRLLSVCC